MLAIMVFMNTVTLPLNNLLIIDEENRDIQTNGQILIKLNLSVREQIVGEK